MTEDQSELLRAAEESLSAAKLLLKGGFSGFAASRAYYTMFYVAQAFLEGKGLSFSKHAGVIAAFGREFAQTGVVPKEFHRFLLEAQEARHNGDYGPFDAIGTTQAENQISRAGDFLAVAHRTIGKP